MKKIYTILIIFLAAIAAYSQAIEITPLDFNTEADDFAPYLTQNGRLMYFCSDNDGGQKIYYVERTSEGWSLPVELSEDINNGEHNGSVTLTPDGQFMIFAAYEHSAGSVGDLDLFNARKVNGEWTDVQILGPEVNSDVWDSQPSITSDGNTLYFASERSGGYGGTDIYVCSKTRTGWSIAKNLGSIINTSSDEMSPIIASDNATLTFSSDKAGGYGGFDIYISRIVNDTFTNPQNAGTPINTSSDEFFYYPLVNTNIAYFSSDRPGGAGGMDIYMAVPNPYKSGAVVLVQGTVKDKATGEPLGANITVTDLIGGKKIADLKSDDISGQYYVVLQPGRNYSITAQKPGYLFYSERFAIPPSEQGHEETKDIYLSPLAGGNTRLLVFFDFDKFDLQQESIPELERVVEFLRDNSEIKIILEGHTDDLGTKEYNQKLSENRSESVKGYLVNAGINASRIRTVGFGKNKPLVNDKTDEARAVNRRVEMKIAE